MELHWRLEMHITAHICIRLVFYVLLVVLSFICFPGTCMYFGEPTNKVCSLTLVCKSWYQVSGFPNFSLLFVCTTFILLFSLLEILSLYFSLFSEATLLAVGCTSGQVLCLSWSAALTVHCKEEDNSLLLPPHEFKVMWSQEDEIPVDVVQWSHVQQVQCSII